LKFFVDCEIATFIPIKRKIMNGKIHENLFILTKKFDFILFRKN
jgi:hypothetical protein